MAKVERLRHTGKTLESQKSGRTIVIDYKGKKASASVSDSSTLVSIDGEKARRGKVRVGMTCTLAYSGHGAQAKEVNCKH